MWVAGTGSSSGVGRLGWRVAIVLAATYAGTTWGLGRTWARLPFVNRNRWAL